MRKYLIATFIMIIMSSFFVGCSGETAHSTEEIVSVSQSDKYLDEKSKLYMPNEGSFSHSKKYAGVRVETEEEAISKGKTILTLADAVGEHGVIAYIVKAFNRDNEYYHVELKTIEQISREEEQNRIKMDLAGGKGPDLMTASAVSDIDKIMTSGCFADLSGFLSELDVSEETFFPSVKAFVVGEKVYGICFDTGCMGYRIKENLCEEDGVPTFEQFIDNLLEYPGNATYMYDDDPATAILGALLIHSQSLRGTVDWDKRKCDFGGELFSKILDVSKRYGDASGKGYEPLVQSYFYSWGSYPKEVAMTERGWKQVDCWFDDGNYPVFCVGLDIMVNAATENMEGARVFLSYVLSAYGQMYCSNPVNREVYRDSMQDIISMVEAGRAYMPEKLTQSIVDEMISNIERGRYAPQDTQEIINIIMEESGAYFSGDKSKEEVIKIIQSRVQLMLSE